MFPYYSTMMLGLESNTVIGLRMLRLVNGGSGALDEMQLMVREKVSWTSQGMLNFWIKIMILSFGKTMDL